MNDTHNLDHPFSFNNNNSILENHNLMKNGLTDTPNHHDDRDASAPLSYSPFTTPPPPPPPYLQMQQLLQQHIFTPNQLQQLLRNHSYYLQQLQQQNKQGMVHPPTSPPHCKNSGSSGTSGSAAAAAALAAGGNPFDTKKQLEQMMTSLQEQLHLNILQQSNFLNPQKIAGSGKKESLQSQMQQNALLQQHQELLQQMQQVQRQYMLQQGLNMPPLSSQRQGE